MKKFQILKNKTDLPGVNILVYRGVTYPLSKKSDNYISQKHPDLDGVPIILDETGMKLRTIQRRAKVGDTVHVSSVPSEQFTEALGDCTNLEGIVIEANNDNVTVNLTKCGLSAHVLILKRNHVVLTNIADTHQVGYVICNECGTIL